MYIKYKSDPYILICSLTVCLHFFRVDLTQSMYSNDAFSEDTAGVSSESK